MRADTANTHAQPAEAGAALTRRTQPDAHRTTRALTARQRALARAGITHASLIALAALFIFPLFYLLARSLMTSGEIFTNPPLLWPRSPQWQNYQTAWKAAPFGAYLRNTCLIVALQVIGVTGSAALCGFGFARLRFPGRNALFGVVLATLMLPQTVTLVPLYIIFKDWGWLNTFLPLTVPGFFGGGAFNIFLFRQFFRTIPIELDEAATIDGATTWLIFTRIVLPLAKPAVTVVATLTFINAWTDIFAPTIFLNTPDNFTLAQGVVSVFQGFYGPPQFQYVAAMAILLILPPLVLFAFVQRYLIEGIALTGLKG